MGMKKSGQRGRRGDGFMRGKRYGGGGKPEEEEEKSKEFDPSSILYVFWEYIKENTKGKEMASTNTMNNVATCELCGKSCKIEVADNECGMFAWIEDETSKCEAPFTQPLRRWRIERQRELRRLTLAAHRGLPAPPATPAPPAPPVPPVAPPAPAVPPTAPPSPPAPPAPAAAAVPPPALAIPPPAPPAYGGGTFDDPILVDNIPSTCIVLSSDDEEDVEENVFKEKYDEEEDPEEDPEEDSEEDVEEDLEEDPEEEYDPTDDEEEEDTD
ncbi:protein cappuccino-like [Telopea speciosissima]|uniref:protein cappuccino-like n=1 Tax=Telopea speciosissima TaxID=54955 RepID=UPI001CC4A127|nr:protein cappuccino-like [Telopea speciosissima]